MNLFIYLYIKHQLCVITHLDTNFLHGFTMKDECVGVISIKILTQKGKPQPFPFFLTPREKKLSLLGFIFVSFRGMSKRVLVVGSGAAGTAAAYSLSRCPEKFDVQVWEKSSVPGGVATTSEIKGGIVINDGRCSNTGTYMISSNFFSQFLKAGAQV